MEHRGPLAADFRRYYALSLAHIRDYDIPVTELADLAANLPPDSAVARSVNPDWWITPQIQMLRQIEHGIRVQTWQRTKDGQRSSPVHFPRPIDFHAESVTADGPDLMTRDEMAAALGWDKKGVA